MHRSPERCLPPTPRPLRSASAPFRAYRRATGAIFGLPFFATRPLPDVLHLQTPVCKERHVGEGATGVMRVNRKPSLLHVGTRETGPKRSGGAEFSYQTGLHESWTGLCPPRRDPLLLITRPQIVVFLIARPQYSSSAEIKTTIFVVWLIASACYAAESHCAPKPLPTKTKEKEIWKKTAPYLVGIG